MLISPGSSDTCVWPLVREKLYGTPMGYCAYRSVQLEVPCHRHDYFCRRTVVESSFNLGVLVSGRMLHECYSTFAFLVAFGWREDFEW